MSVQLFLPARRRKHRALTGATIIPIAALITTSLALPAQAANNPAPSASAAFNTQFAKQGATVTLTVTTTGTTCVDVSGAFTAHQESANAKPTWTFTTTTGAGEGAQAVNVVASEKFNGNGTCTGQSTSAQASYTLDNTGPVVTGVVTPARNAAGWNKDNVTVTWSATDSGSGVGTGPTPATDTVNSETGGVTKTATAVDQLGNTGNGQVLVMLDKTAPSIDASRSPAANAAGWNNTNVTVGFTCSDTLSGIKSCTGGGTVVLSTEGANQSVPGTAVDNADNTNNAGVTGINIDKTAPSLTGTPTTSANTNGWYKDDVTIGWTASDALSGLANGIPPNSTLTGEGSGLKATASVSDKADNTTTADSAAVNIDRTAPTTGITGTSNNWTNGAVTVSLSPDDNLSGVDSTSYAVDGGDTETGTSFSLSSEGDHTVTFFSTDKAGNAETARNAHIKIDKTAPTIRHSFTPDSYEDGTWTNQDVTVTFACTDAGSDVARCSAPVTTSTEGEAQQVNGTATDNAGNSATDTAVVSIDKTKPTINAASDRPANDAGWYKDDVSVNFSATDGLSGVAAKSAAKVLGEGADQSAVGTATDAAGNSDSAGVTGINVDKTPPTLTASVSSGWHTSDVTVDWSCTDALSGVVAQPADDTVTGEGGNLSSTATCTDKAGNTATRTVSGIQIDRSAPTTTAAVPDPLAGGWYADAVQVTLTGHDAISGVGITYYSVDGGPAQTYRSAFPFATKGTHTITYWSKDVAGNVEDRTGKSNSITLKIDGNAPTTTVINPISPASGWFVTSGIPVAFDANDAESGIAATYYQIDGGAQQTYGEPFEEDLSTGSHTITYWSVDLAGNVEAEQTTHVNVDTVPPTISASRTPEPNGHGWNNTDVDVKFTCNDADSHIDEIVGCGPDATVSDEGANQTVQGDTQDVAGNANSTTVGPINIDKTAPSLIGTATTDPNGAGWYNRDVKIAWSADDGLSGVEAQPADSTITGEGSNLGTTASVTDRAGNQKTASVSGIKIDRTAPVVNGGPTTSPNAAGWYRDQVVVDFTCTDNLSSIAYCPTSKIISGDAANQSITSDAAGDKAGNVGGGKTVSGINLDGTAPSTTANNQCTKVNGYCTGPTANVVLSANDALSGVKELHYKVDGGAEQTSAGASKTVSVPLDGSGAGTVTYWAVDNAGNTEPANSVALKWDNIAPTVSHIVSPAPNANEWNRSDVTVTFTAKDDDAGSGVASTTAPVTVSSETSGQVVTGSATDTAGNVGTDSVTVRIDKTVPVITAAIVSGTKGSNGWYTGEVGVHFTCSDSLSGIATCPDDVTLINNGTNSATGTAIDKAGNSATVTLADINVDKELPTITDVSVTGGSSYVLGAVPAATCTAVDSFSGLAGPCTVTVTGGTPNGVGTFTYKATATDKAGNKVTTEGTYKVVYRFDGYLQPINDTAHQVGLSTSVFKGGSTVPAKFQLKKADGTVVQANTAPAWWTPVRGSAMNMPVDESVYAASSDSGNTYRYDSSAQQYIYNWKTGAGGNYWRIGVTLDDGQTYYVNIGLKG